MNIIDACIIVLLLSGGVGGAKNGFFRQTVFLVGTIVCFILAWIFKNPIANFLSYNLPFFNFTGPIKGLTSLNIVLYQLIAFLLLLCLFTAVLVVLIKMTKVFEKILKMTIVLAIPSKILGFIVGMIETYIILFVILFFINQPVFNLDIVNESKFKGPILNSSPGLSNIVEDLNDSVIDIYDITKSKGNESVKETNKKIVKTLQKHKVIDDKYLTKLREKGKINY